MISKQVKKILIGLAVVALAILGIAYGGRGSTSQESTGLTSSRVDGPIEEGVVAQSNDEFLSMLLNVRNITIDTSLFKNEAFLYLKDHPIVLGTDTIGRPNPFAPVGTDPLYQNVSVNQPTSQQFGSTALPATGIETLQPGKVRATSAELGASVNFPAGTGPAVVTFEYGTSEASFVPTESLIINAAGTVTLPVSGLLRNTKYFVRASLGYGTQTLRGSIMSFTTPAQ